MNKLLTAAAEQLVAEAHLRDRLRRVETEARAHLIRNDPRPR